MFNGQECGERATDVIQSWDTNKKTLKCSQVYNSLLHMDVPQQDFQSQIHEGVVQDNRSQKHQEFYMMFYKLVQERVMISPYLTEMP